MQGSFIPICNRPSGVKRKKVCLTDRDKVNVVWLCGVNVDTNHQEQLFSNFGDEIVAIQKDIKEHTVNQASINNLCETFHLPDKPFYFYTDRYTMHGYTCDKWVERLNSVLDREERLARLFKLVESARGRSEQANNQYKTSNANPPQADVRALSRLQGAANRAKDSHEQQQSILHRNELDILELWEHRVYV